MSQKQPSVKHFSTHEHIILGFQILVDKVYRSYAFWESPDFYYYKILIAGNYYSLRGYHEKAVLYFRQALKLNPRHVVAWTLLGHEYVELKNTSAAIESYRRATG